MSSGFTNKLCPDCGRKLWFDNCGLLVGEECTLANIEEISTDLWKAMFRHAKKNKNLKKWFKENVK